MALDVDLTPPWAGILEGDELAHVTAVPARDAVGLLSNGLGSSRGLA